MKNYYPDQTRNLNPHKSASAAIWLWGKEYSQQDGGIMDFWDKLSPADKRIARSLVANIMAVREETPEEYEQTGLQNGKVN